MQSTAHIHQKNKGASKRYNGLYATWQSTSKRHRANRNTIIIFQLLSGWRQLPNGGSRQIIISMTLQIVAIICDTISISNTGDARGGSTKFHSNIIQTSLIEMHIST